MQLSDLSKWALIYEDEKQCFSKAVITSDASPVYVITFYKAEELPVSLKYLIPDHLYNLLAFIESHENIHLILHAVEGPTLKKYLKTQTTSYNDRVQMCTVWLNAIENYELFPDAVKLQLVDADQLAVESGLIVSRELVDYVAEPVKDAFRVIRQLGKTLDLVLFDAKGDHEQFIDNLIRGNLNYTTFKAVKRHFKDLFVYEKPEAIEHLCYEYDILLNDLTAGPVLDYTALKKNQSVASELPIPETIETSENPAIAESPSVIESEAQTPTATVEEIAHESAHEFEQKFEQESEQEFEQDTERTSNCEPESEPLQDTESSIEPKIEPETEPETEPKSETESRIEPNIEPESEAKPEANPVNISEPVHIRSVSADTALFDELKTLLAPSDAPVEEKHTKPTEKSPSREPDMPDTLPKFTSKRSADEEDPHLDKEVDAFFDAFEEDAHKKRRIPWQIGILVIIIAIVLFFAVRCGASTPVSAQFDIESLPDNRVAFINQSEGGKQISAYEWSIYYNGTLVQTFSDEDLFPIFETAGNYTIALRVQSKDGTWSDPFSLDYTVEN